MADTKITALTALTAADPANDVIPIVDVSDTSMAASGTTKKISVNNIIGAGGVASFSSSTVSGTLTAGAATITGDLTVDTSTLKVDSTNNRVGIGTASPLTTFQVQDATLTGAGQIREQVIRAAADNANNSLNSLVGFTFSTGSAAYTAGTLVRTSGVYGINLDNSAFGRTVGLSFYTCAQDAAATEKMRIDSSGNVGIGVTPAGTGGCLQLKSGVTFPATQVASSDANTLDDYEEGTFTPTVRGSTVAGTGVYTTQAGLYTKVGRLVTITVYLNWTAVTLGTGNLQFAGLPFTASSSPVTYNGISIGFVSNIATTAGTVLYGIVEPGSTVITMTQTPTGGGAYGLVPLDTSGEIAFTSTYYV